jgi:hypothetical protein
MSGGTTTTQLCVYTCSLCPLKLHVDGGEELLLIKGTWQSPAFFTAGALLEAAPVDWSE